MWLSALSPDPHKPIFQPQGTFCSLNSSTVPHLCPGYVYILKHFPRHPAFLPRHARIINRIVEIWIEFLLCAVRGWRKGDGPGRQRLWVYRRQQFLATHNPPPPTQTPLRTHHPAGLSSLFSARDLPFRTWRDQIRQLRGRSSQVTFSGSPCPTLLALFFHLAPPDGFGPPQGTQKACSNSGWLCVLGPQLSHL